MQIAEALLVALAPGGDAVAEPVFLHNDFAAELVAVGFFLFQDGVAPGLEMRESLFELAGYPAIQPERGAGDAFQ